MRPAMPKRRPYPKITTTKKIEREGMRGPEA
jgi:hypothetical protein